MTSMPLPERQRTTTTQPAPMLGPAAVTRRSTQRKFQPVRHSAKEQIDYLKTIEDGPDNDAPDHGFLDWFLDQYQKHWEPTGHPAAILCATAEGGILVEWKTNTDKFSLEVDPGATGGEIIRFSKSEPRERPTAGTEACLAQAFNPGHRYDAWPELVSAIVQVDSRHGWEQVARFIGSRAE